jgi:hypothetical protein
MRAPRRIDPVDPVASKTIRDTYLDAYPSVPTVIADSVDATRGR